MLRTCTHTILERGTVSLCSHVKQQLEVEPRVVIITQIDTSESLYLFRAHPGFNTFILRTAEVDEGLYNPPAQCLITNTQYLSSSARFQVQQNKMFKQNSTHIITLKTRSVRSEGRNRCLPLCQITLSYCLHSWIYYIFQSLTVWNELETRVMTRVRLILMCGNNPMTQTARTVLYTKQKRISDSSTKTWNSKSLRNMSSWNKKVSESVGVFSLWAKAVCRSCAAFYAFQHCVEKVKSVLWKLSLAATNISSASLSDHTHTRPTAISYSSSAGKTHSSFSNLSLKQIFLVCHTSGHLFLHTDVRLNFGLFLWDFFTAEWPFLTVVFFFSILYFLN